MACISNSPARASWTLLISASSAFRCRVSCTSRAFSSATLRLPASVISRRWSASVNACSRSKLSSAMTPVARPPVTSGTNRIDFGVSPATTALPRLLDRARPRERGADVLADEREQILVLHRVADILGVRLDDEDADRRVLCFERDSEPGALVRSHPDRLDLAPCDQLVVPLE